jgi:hypothetical protein
MVATVALLFMDRSASQDRDRSGGSSRLCAKLNGINQLTTPRLTKTRDGAGALVFVLDDRAKLCPSSCLPRGGLF